MREIQERIEKLQQERLKLQAEIDAAEGVLRSLRKPVPKSVPSGPVTIEQLRKERLELRAEIEAAEEVLRSRRKSEKKALASKAVTPLEITPGTVALHVDPAGCHVAVVLSKRRSGYLKALFFTSHKRWARQDVRREINPLEVGESGFRTWKTTYVSPDLRPGDGFLPTGIVLTYETVEALIAEFGK